jgi:hypothetical protein
MNLKVTVKYQGTFIDKPQVDEFILDGSKVVAQKPDEETGEMIRVTLAELYRRRTLGDNSFVSDDFEEYISQIHLAKKPYSNRVLEIDYKLVK